ncbi:two-component regulator propeller domain-containing protein, partial [Holdemanella sp. DFI.5.21]
MWVGTDRGLFKVDIKNLKIQVLDYDKANQNSLTNSYIKCLEDDDKNNLWIGTTSGINIIDK